MGVAFRPWVGKATNPSRVVNHDDSPGRGCGACKVFIRRGRSLGGGHSEAATWIGRASPARAVRNRSSMTDDGQGAELAREVLLRSIREQHAASRQCWPDKSILARSAPTEPAQCQPGGREQRPTRNARQLGQPPLGIGVSLGLGISRSIASSKWFAALPDPPFPCTTIRPLGEPSVRVFLALAFDRRCRVSDTLA